MDLIDNAINKRAMNGYFPVEKLYPSNIEALRKIDIDAQSIDGISFFTEHPDVLSLYIISIRQRVAEHDSLNQPYSNAVNYYINGRCSEDYLRINGSLQKAFNLIPVVTSLDKVLWFGANAFEIESEYNHESEYDTVSMMFTWIKLLDMAQEMELKTRRTVDIRKVNLSTNLIALIRSGFDSAKYKRATRELSNNEYERLKRLYKQKESLLSEIQEEKKESEDISYKTQEEWDLFIDIVNDISERESNAIKRINESVSAKDKLRVIYQYNSIITRIEKGKYLLGDKEIDLNRLLDAVNERMLKASTYASACIEGENPFRLSHAFLMLVMKPLTFNNFFLQFHLFRLDPTKENAKKFLSIALDIIKKNLGGEERKWVSLDEMIQDFYNTVFKFMNENKVSIDNLSFEKIQPNAVTVFGTELDSFLGIDLQQEAVDESIRLLKNSEEYEEAIKRFLKGRPRAVSVNAARMQLKEEQHRYELVKQQAIARKMVYSLNIVYLFCDALRIMLSNRRINIKIKHAEVAKQYRKELLVLDDKLVHKIYSNMDVREIGMLEYRERTGIIASTLSEKEVWEEKYRNALFAEIFKESVESLTTGLENQDLEQLIKTKTKIRGEILRFPDCDDKEQYAYWLDSVSSRISEALINRCKKQEDNEYLLIKRRIKTSLGKHSDILPETALDSLTTAELLYGKYVSDEFAEIGFDFSCISALYYQAFEDAYNDTIWRNYATMLNGLEINGQKFTEILDKNRNKMINEPDAQGYLENGKNTYKQRNYYINYKNKVNPQTIVSLRCMYKSFAILMENVRDSSNLIGFCEYFAKLAGYTGRQEMFSDDSFMNKCHDFTEAVLNSVDNRNNASHGGTFISVVQCMHDKKTVINNMEAVRINSIGLIQQLLYLLESK